MKRPVIFAALEIVVGILGLLERQFFGERHHAEKLRSVAFQPAEIHFSQFD